MKKLIYMLSACLILGCSARNDLYSTHYSGTLELTQHVLGSKVSGRLNTLTVKEGDIVKVGTQIATFDRYDQAKKDLERLQELFKTGGATAQSVEYAQLTLEDQQIIAPVEGIVLIKSAEVGETLQAGAGVVVLGNPQDQWIKVYLPESLVGQIQLNQKAQVHVEGINKSYPEHISYIATKGEFTPRNLQSKEDRMTQVFAIKVSLDMPDQYIHPGVSAEVQFLK